MLRLRCQEPRQPIARPANLQEPRPSLLTRRSRQSVLKEINPECSLEGLKLKLQYFGHLMRSVDSLEKTLMLGKIERRRRRDERVRWLDGITLLTRPL